MDSIFISENVDEVVSHLGDHTTFAFDIETTGLNPLDSRVLLWQIATPEKNYVIDARANLAPLFPFFSDKRWTKIIHNAKFDTKFLLHHYNIFTHSVFDTFLAEVLLCGGGPDFVGGSLAAVSQKYLGITLDKSTRQSFIDMKPMAMFTDEQLRYAGQDTDVLFPIMEAQLPILTDRGLTRVREMEFDLAPIVASMELTGVPIDKRRWSEQLSYYMKQYEASRLRMHEELFDKAGLDEQMGMFERDGINLRSPKQVSEAFKKIGIDVEKTDERTLSLIDHPAVKEMLEYRRLNKAITSYGDSFLDKVHPFTGRIHADYQQIGTDTGRFACREPNLQQMPEEFRACVAEEGYMIVGADYANIELRILAELSDDKNLISAFESGADPHKSTASLMFNTPIENVTKDQRFIAKTINFGISYGMGPNKLMDILNKDKPQSQHLTYKRVEAIMKRYKETYGGATQWLQDAGNSAYRRSYSETMMGRRRYYSRPDLNSEDRDKDIAHIKRQGANSPIQGTNADITKLAMVNLFFDLKNYYPSAHIILQVHDEIAVLAHKRDAESVKLLVEESMTESAKMILKKVPVRADAYVSENWKK